MTTDVHTELGNREQTKSLDADSSKDLRGNHEQTESLDADSSKDLRGNHEQTKSLDADSSKDLRALLTHSDDESETTTARPVTKHSSHKPSSSKGHSKSKTAVRRPSNETVVPSPQTLMAENEALKNGRARPSSETVAPTSQTMAENEALKNGSFLQSSLGEINPTAQQSHLSSVMSGITPQDAPLLPARDTDSNVTENVSDTTEGPVYSQLLL